ncbi:PIR protein [Plasmodium vivax]|uniref:VIR protein n=1 Tax=Plasmodium vivax TaxID=5855 RepID=A0A564ZSY9_PLAVI|nr:PIR protein [Plasmodium vivax]
MSGQTTEPEYFNDKTYNELRKNLEKYKKLKYDNAYTNNFIDLKKQEIRNLTYLEKTIRYLREFIISGHVNYSYAKGNVCKYINFWLNTEIRQFNDFKDGANFDLFKEFAQGCSKDYYRNDSGECKGFIHYIDPDTYDKMETLYKLYELYEKLRSPIPDVDNPCTIFGQIIANYNDALKEYDKESGEDSNLIKKLLDFKNLTLNLVLPPENECPYKKGLFEEPNKYLKRLKDIETKGREEELQRKKAQEELQRQKEQKAQDELERHKSQKLLQEEEFHTNTPFRDGENLLLAALAQQNQGGHSLDVESTGGIGYIGRQESPRTSSFLSKQLEQTERGHREFKDQSMDTSTTSGFTGSITDTISGFIKEVDPAPVLGVSGGMGVLFILFKYTPVGSFFGGRRRRMHQIPSSFRGFPPGYFANFQEYDGGFIGYSPVGISPLAE